ncbi:hypothetical protein [Anabaena sp. UHCC 0451]|uniref:hypothetical protein n=1 Tax=Anabaena sp. UHCC 0451 TaxID=2055235 RepID=UPI002B20B8BD|nr:hypothetical protein [Anabaena sp. UHCC 0451]MEA5576580.1 hypothetical protein [Anabaena sp. UHCC 0451]
MTTRRFLGREYQYCLKTPSGKETHARLMASNAIPVGTKVELLTTGNSVHFFPG